MNKFKVCSHLTKARPITFMFLWALSSSLVQAQIARQVAQRAFPSVVLLLMEDANGQPISLGSGFFVKENIVATNLHVIEEASRGYAKIVGKNTKYEVDGTVGIDKQRDLVLLKITGIGAPYLSLGDISQVAVGDEVYVISNPQGLEGTFSQGIVSSIRKVGNDTLFQITAPISPGSSGGPVLNTQGEVIGIAVAAFKSGQNLNFAIPVSYLAILLSETKPVAPLSEKSTAKQQKSILNDLGGESVEGVIGGQFEWKSNYVEWGDYSFSLRNQLRNSVKDIYCLVIFYDRQGAPLEADEQYYSGVIAGGLAKRISGHVDGTLQRLTGKVKFRILSFKIID